MDLKKHHAVGPIITRSTIPKLPVIRLADWKWLATLANQLDVPLIREVRK